MASTILCLAVFCAVVAVGQASLLPPLPPIPPPAVLKLLTCIADYLGDDLSKSTEPCVYACPSSQQLAPKANYQPTQNGCGPSQIGNLYYIFENATHLCPYFTDCCNAHDHCYGTCAYSNPVSPANGKKTCDDNLLNCWKNPVNANYLLYPGCTLVADLLYLTVVYGGCSPWQSSQADACVCQ